MNWLCSTTLSVSAASPIALPSGIASALMAKALADNATASVKTILRILSLSLVEFDR
jgi:hypothetical protein